MPGKKLFPLLLILGMIISGLSQGEEKEDSYIREGAVYDSSDGFATIYIGEMSPVWNCTNITVYKNLTELAIDDNTTDTGGGYKNYDTFGFDFGLRLTDLKDGDEVIAVGESRLSKNYTFITSHIITERVDGGFNTTEWEPIPEPVVNGKGASWINISIPKFKNPQKELYDNPTTNDDNTISFAVYRSEKNNSWTLDKDYLKVENATYYNETCYFYNDTNLSPRTNYYYAVAVIAKGGYITHGKSLGVEIHTTPLIILNSPNGNEDWSGNSLHLINYTIQDGEPPYLIDLYYSADDANWSFINTTTCNQPGTYTYDWTTPLIDSSTVRVRINVTDNKSAADFDTSDDTFEIDSIPPTVENTLPGNGSSCSPSASLAIEFDEPMNKTSAEAAFSYTNGTEIWTSADGEINWIDNVMTFTPYEEFEIGMQYNCTVSVGAKDDSDPGNAMIRNYTWSFVAAPGWGNFSVDVDYPLGPIQVGEICQIKVTITNALDAENKSGGLIVKFLKSANGKDFISIDTKTVSEMFPGNSTMVYVNFSLIEWTWYLKVNFTSTNPDDVINSYRQYYETPIYTVEVVPPEEIREEEEGIGLGPCALITVMVIAVVVIAVFVLLSGKKK